MDCGGALAYSDQESCAEAVAPLMSRAVRIVVINAKGGCGKTTVATNLAVAYARQGWRVALVDQDSQGSATDWAEQRGTRQPKIEMVPQHGAPLYQTRAWRNRLPQGTQRAVIDAASVVDVRDVNERFREADAFIVPILPSSLDIRAGSKFIAGLLTHRAYRSRPLPIGVVANRVVRNTNAYERLKRFLDCLEVPTLATFADSQLYLRAVEEGAGILDFQHSQCANAESEQWQALVDWLEANAAKRDGHGAKRETAAAPAVPETIYRPPTPAIASSRPLPTADAAPRRAARAEWQAATGADRRQG